MSLNRDVAEVLKVIHAPDRPAWDTLSPEGARASYMAGRAATAPEPVPAPEPPAKTLAQASGSPAYAQRNPRWTGRPPGLLEEDLGPRDAGTTGGAAEDPGTQRDMSGGEPSMDIGGFQIIYDLLAEERLRTWQA